MVPRYPSGMEPFEFEVSIKETDPGEVDFSGPAKLGFLPRVGDPFWIWPSNGDEADFKVVKVEYGIVQFGNGLAYTSEPETVVRVERVPPEVESTVTFVE